MINLKRVPFARKNPYHSEIVCDTLKILLQIYTLAHACIESILFKIAPNPFTMPVQTNADRFERINEFVRQSIISPN